MNEDKIPEYILEKFEAIGEKHEKDEGEDHDTLGSVVSDILGEEYDRKHK